MGNKVDFSEARGPQGGLSRDDIEWSYCFKNYDWPGSVRELMKVLKRAVIVSPERALRLPEGTLGGKVAPPAEVPRIPFVGFTTLEDLEREYITQVLEYDG